MLIIFIRVDTGSLDETHEVHCRLPLIGLPQSEDAICMTGGLLPIPLERPPSSMVGIFTENVTTLGSRHC